MGGRGAAPRPGQPTCRPGTRTGTSSPRRSCGCRPTCPGCWTSWPRPACGCGAGSWPTSTRPRSPPTWWSTRPVSGARELARRRRADRRTRPGGPGRRPGAGRVDAGRRTTRTAWSTSIPRGTDVVCGGTAPRRRREHRARPGRGRGGSWPAAARWCPELAGTPVLGHAVGVRPARTGGPAGARGRRRALLRARRRRRHAVLGLRRRGGPAGRADADSRLGVECCPSIAVGWGGTATIRVCVRRGWWSRCCWSLLLSVWAVGRVRSRRRFATSAERVTFETLHTASLAAPPLRLGLNGDLGRQVGPPPAHACSARRRWRSPTPSALLAWEGPGDHHADRLWTAARDGPLATGRPIVVRPARPVLRLTRMCPVRGAVVVPIAVDDRVVGTLAAVTSTEPGPGWCRPRWRPPAGCPPSWSWPSWTSPGPGWPGPRCGRCGRRSARTSSTTR